MMQNVFIKLKLQLLNIKKITTRAEYYLQHIHT